MNTPCDKTIDAFDLPSNAEFTSPIAQAIEAGELIDLQRYAAERGIECKLLISNQAREALVVSDPTRVPLGKQDRVAYGPDDAQFVQAGRTRRLVASVREFIETAPENTTEGVWFLTYQASDREDSRDANGVRYAITYGPGDYAEPVLTIKLANEV